MNAVIKLRHLAFLLFVCVSFLRVLGRSIVPDLHQVSQDTEGQWPRVLRAKSSTSKKSVGPRFMRPNKTMNSRLSEKIRKAASKLTNDSETGIMNTRCRVVPNIAPISGLMSDRSLAPSQAPRDKVTMNSTLLFLDTATPPPAPMRPTKNFTSASNAPARLTDAPNLTPMNSTKFPTQSLSSAPVFMSLAPTLSPSNFTLSTSVEPTFTKDADLAIEGISPRPVFICRQTNDTDEEVSCSRECVSPDAVGACNENEMCVYGPVKCQVEAPGSSFDEWMASPESQELSAGDEFEFPSNSPSDSNASQVTLSSNEDALIVTGSMSGRPVYTCRNTTVSDEDIECSRECSPGDSLVGCSQDEFCEFGPEKCQIKGPTSYPEGLDLAPDYLL